MLAPTEREKIPREGKGSCINQDASRWVGGGGGHELINLREGEIEDNAAQNLVILPLIQDCFVPGEGEGLDSEEGVGGGLPQSAQETPLPALLPHQRSSLTSGGSGDIRGWSRG